MTRLIFLQALTDPGVFSAIGGLLNLVALVASVGNVVVGRKCTLFTIHRAMC